MAGLTKGGAYLFCQTHARLTTGKTHLKNPLCRHRRRTAHQQFRDSLVITWISGKQTNHWIHWVGCDLLSPIMSLKNKIFPPLRRESGVKVGAQLKGTSSSVSKMTLTTSLSLDIAYNRLLNTRGVTVCLLQIVCDKLTALYFTLPALYMVCRVWHRLYIKSTNCQVQNKWQQPVPCQINEGGSHFFILSIQLQRATDQHMTSC